LREDLGCTITSILLFAFSGDGDEGFYPQEGERVSSVLVKMIVWFFDVGKGKEHTKSDQ